MTLHSTPSGEGLDVTLPSGRLITLRGMGDGVNAVVDDDRGEVEDVKFRVPDFTRLVSTLQEVCELLKATVRPLAPEEVVLEIGVGLNAKTGKVFVLFGEASSEASLKVTIKWSFNDRGTCANQA